MSKFIRTSEYGAKPKKGPANTFLHDLEHLLGGGGDAIGEEGDEQGNVVHGLEVRPDVLDPPGQLRAVRHVVVQLVGVARHAGRGLGGWQFNGINNCHKLAPNFTLN